MQPFRYSLRAAWLATIALTTIAMGLYALPAPAASTFLETVDGVQPKIVKIYGAGGFRGLEPYQSGFLVSSDGHIVTAWSYVLDTDEITVILNDGRVFTAQFLGGDPLLEVAVLKIEAAELPCFELAEAREAGPGTRVLAFSNLFNVATGDEPASVQHGQIAATTHLQARRGGYETPYRGPAYVLDAMTNNPGAAGGALCNVQGELLAMLGKELRNSQTNTWLNYAIPIDQLRPAIDGIRAGNYTARTPEDPAQKPDSSLTLAALGIVLLPDVLERTPPFVDEVRRGSPAEQAGIRPDDLVLFVGEHLVQSCRALRAELEYIDSAAEVKLTVMRGQELISVTLTAPPAE